MTDALHSYLPTALLFISFSHRFINAEQQQLLLLSWMNSFNIIICVLYYGQHLDMAVFVTLDVKN